MRKSRFTDEQMVKILRECDSKPVAEVAKKHGVSDGTLYIWRKQFGTMEVADAKRLKGLEAIAYLTMSGSARGSLAHPRATS